MIRGVSENTTARVAGGGRGCLNGTSPLTGLVTATSLSEMGANIGLPPGINFFLDRQIVSSI